MERTFKSMVVGRRSDVFISKINHPTSPPQTASFPKEFTMSTMSLHDNASRRSLLKGAAAMSIGLATAGGAEAKALTSAHTGQSMAGRLTTKDGASLYYKDWGSGPVVVFSHGYPLSSDAWEDQMFFLSQNGYRVIGS